MDKKKLQRLEKAEEKYNGNDVFHDPIESRKYVYRQCDNCNEEYYARRAHLKQGSRIHCSKICSSQKKAKERFGIST